MKYLQLLYLAIGVALLVAVVQQVDLGEVWQQVGHLSWFGLIVVIGIYFLAFLSDVWAWQLTFISLPSSFRWLSRLFLVRIVGEAFNRITPMASMGGEPLKVYLLKHRYQIGYRESGVSLLLAKTLDTLALVIFLCIGFLLLLGNEKLSDRFKIVAGVALALLSSGIIIFFLLQRFQLLSAFSNRLDRTRWSKHLGGFLSLLQDTDRQLSTFYKHPQRFRFTLAVAFLNWPLGTLEMYYILKFLGHPVTFGEAWIVEAMVQLVRAGIFFIPASLGTQEGTFILVCSAITGNPGTGLAVSIVKRFRELLWILAGLAVGWLLSSPSLPRKIN